MRKWLLFLLATPALAQTAVVTGKIQNYNPGIAPNALGNYVEFALTNCGNNTPLVNGTAVLLSKPIDFYPDSTGALSAGANGGITPALYGNDIINCGGAYTSRYSVRYFVGGVAQGPAKFYFIPSTSPFNLTTATPIGLQPPLSPPYPNLTTCTPGSYSNGLNPDLSVKCLNLPNGASNAVVVNPTATQEIAAQPLVLDGPLTGKSGTFQTTNGVLNAARFTGGDIGAQVNAAFATCSSSCEVDIPIGTYSQSTDIVMPNSASTTLRMMPGTVLNYSGTGYSIRTTQGPGWGGGTYQGFYFIKGGLIFGTSSAKGGILLQAATSGIDIDGTAVTGFTAGDGFLDVGSNSVKIASSKSIGNLVGVHLMASPGFASNNVLVERSSIAGNKWGVINGDVSQWASPWIFTGTTGVASPNFNDVFFMDTFEGNTAGAAIDGLTTGSQYLDDYFEGNPRGVVVGMTESPITTSQYALLYNISGNNGGTSTGESVSGNYWTLGSSLHSQIELRASGNLVVTGNSSNGSSTACMVDAYVGANPYIGPNQSGATTQLCQGGSPGWPFANQIPTSINVAGNGAFTGTLNSGALTQTGTFILNQGTGFSGGSIGAAIGLMGPWTLYATLTAPSGACSPGSFDIGAFGFAVCQSGTWVTK